MAHLSALGVGLPLAFLVSATCLAATHSIDQQNATSDGTRGEGTERIAQTFTVGTSGTLDQVDLMLVLSNLDAPGNAAVEIEAVDGSGNPVYPLGPALSTGTGAIPSTPSTWVSIAMTPLAVTAGQHYAIIVTPGTFFATDFTFGTDKYNRGQAFEGAVGWATVNEDPNADLTFRTYVTPNATPPPAAPTATPPVTSSLDGGSQGGSNGIVPMLGLGFALFAGTYVIVLRRKPALG